MQRGARQDMCLSNLQLDDPHRDRKGLIMSTCSVAKLTNKELFLLPFTIFFHSITFKKFIVFTTPFKQNILKKKLLCKPPINNKSLLLV